MGADDGLICAYALDGQGGGREVGWPEIRAWQPGDGLLWVHLDRTGHESRAGCARSAASTRSSPAG